MAKRARQRVSASEYGRQRGVSHVAVLKAIKDGRIIRHPGGIDPDEADAALAAHGETYSAAIRRKESARASLLELELSVKRSEVVPISLAQQAAETFASNTRSRLLMLSSKLAQRLVGIESQATIKNIVDGEVFDCLTELVAHSADGID